MLAQARVVHFATHGLLDTQRPENSGLVLALFNPRGQAQDGYLRVSDIYSLKLSADLVVLSSCASALGRDMGSEGIIGLPRAFLYAGAQRVIASLWQVDDDATAALMAYFYEDWKEGQSPPAALAHAQSRLAREPRFHDPRFWAAFFLEGEYR
jgi:CHAT domain-containing protein